MKSVTNIFWDWPYRLLRRIALSRAGRAVLRGFRELSQAAWQADLLASLKRHGEDVHFQYPNTIHCPQRMEVGSTVHVAGFFHCWAGGGVVMGDRVMIGSHVAIATITHDYSLDDMYHSVIPKPIHIGDDVWIGAHAVILPGVTIGNGAVIGAGAVVTRDVPPGAIIVGVPGRVARHRLAGAELAQAE